MQDKKGIFKYVLGELCSDLHLKLLNINLFEKSVKKAAYDRLTSYTKAHGISNSPLCARSGNNNFTASMI